MQIDPNNEIVKYCAKGMELEGQGRRSEAYIVFQEAWNASMNDVEKFISAHYLARHQETIEDKLRWDLVALKHALRSKDENVKSALPSLYLNIGKCYEDLKDINNAKANYQLAASFAALLKDDGYGNMIRAGIENGLSRTATTAL